MRNIRGELSAVSLGEFTVGYIKRKYNRAEYFAVGFYCTEVELIFKSAYLLFKLAVLAQKRRFDRVVHLRAVLDRHEIFARRVVRAAENAACSLIYAYYFIIFPDNYKPLAHAVGNSVEFFLFLLQFGNISVYLPLLNSQPAQNGRKFLIRIVFERIFKVEFFQRLDNFFRDPRGKQRREYYRDNNRNRYRLNYAHSQRKRGHIRRRNTQNRPVRQPFRAVNRLFRER